MPNRLVHLIVLVLAAGRLGAQPVLMPESFEVAAPAPVRLATREDREVGLVPVPWPTQVERLFTRVGGAQTNYLADNPPPWRLPAPDASGLISCPIDRPGVAMIGLELQSSEAEWAEDMLAAFAARSALAGPCPPGPARVRRIISAATLVRSAGPAAPGPEDATPTGKSGLRAELRPLVDPTRAVLPTEVPIRMYVEGEGVPRAVLIATHLPTGRTQHLATDAKGIASVRIDEPGAWLVRFHAMIRSDEGPESLWIAASGSITFEAPAPPARGEAPDPGPVDGAPAKEAPR